MENRILRAATIENGTSLSLMVSMEGQVHGEQDPQGGYNGERDQPLPYGKYGGPCPWRTGSSGRSQWRTGPASPLW